MENSILMLFCSVSISLMANHFFWNSESSELAEMLTSNSFQLFRRISYLTAPLAPEYKNIFFRDTHYLMDLYLFNLHLYHTEPTLFEWGEKSNNKVYMCSMQYVQCIAPLLLKIFLKCSTLRCKIQQLHHLNMSILILLHA